MFEKISGIDILGKCFKEEAKLELFNENTFGTIIFGRNGSGKTTISNAFTQIKADNHPSINLQSYLYDKNETKIELGDMAKNIYVFNEDFIDAYVKNVDDSLNSIVVIGNNAKHKDELDDLQKQLKDFQERKENIESLIEDDNNAKKVGSLASKKIELKKQVREKHFARIKQIRGLQKNPPYYEDKIKDILKRSMPAEKKNVLDENFSNKLKALNEIRNNNARVEKEVALIAGEYPLDVNIQGLLEKKIEKVELNEREKYLLSLYNQKGIDHIRKMKSLFNNKSIDKCPYCGQSMSESYKEEMIEGIQKILKKEAADHLEELESLKLIELQFDGTPFNKIDEKLVQDINSKIVLFNDKLSILKNDIEIKINDIFTPVKGALDLKESYNEILSLMDQLENKRIKYNEGLNKERLIDELMKISEELCQYELKPIYRELTKLESKNQKNVAELVNLNKQIEDKKARLTELNSIVSSENIAIDEINKDLSFVFADAHRMKLVPSDKDHKYQIQSNDDSVDVKNISVGERNIIALSYFFTTILENKNKDTALNEEYLIVIDDPISSFDRENQIGIYTFLNNKITNFTMGNKNTRVIVLSHDLYTANMLQKTFDSIRKRIKDVRKNNAIKFVKLENKMFINTNLKNEYKYLMLTVSKFAFDDIENNNDIHFQIGNIMRRLAEAFCTFEYSKGLNDVLSILSKNENFSKEECEYYSSKMFRLILDDESHMQETVGEKVDFSFDENWNNDEKRVVARDLICLLYKLNKDHVRSYLYDKNNDSYKYCELIEHEVENIKSQVISSNDH